MLVNLAVLQELITDAIPDREAFIWRDRRYTYRQLAERCRRFANALIRLGLGCRTERARLQPWQSGQDHVAIYLYNGNEYIEAMYGSYKARATSVNINYRYKPEELLYVLRGSAARAIVFHASLAPTLAAIRDQLPETIEHFIQVADESGTALLEGALDYEALLAASSPEKPDLPYTADDLYVLFTGGTTGMPKGVLWRHEDVFYNGLGGHIPGFPRLDTEEQLVQHVSMGIGGKFIILTPFMHGAAQWAAFNTFHRGGNRGVARRGAPPRRAFGLAGGGKAPGQLGHDHRRCLCAPVAGGAAREALRRFVDADDRQHRRGADAVGA